MKLTHGLLEISHHKDEAKGEGSEGQPVISGRGHDVTMQQTRESTRQAASQAFATQHVPVHAEHRPVR
jgi:hypothetical protein